jgi:hypothetical protein
LKTHLIGVEPDVGEQGVGVHGQRDDAPVARLGHGGGAAHTGQEYGRAAYDAQAALQQRDGAGHHRVAGLDDALHGTALLRVVQVTRAQGFLIAHARIDIADGVARRKRQVADVLPTLQQSPHHQGRHLWRHAALRRHKGGHRLGH